MKRLTRMEVLPVAAALPWGLMIGPFAYLPLPVRMKLQVLAPIAWPELPPAAADDPATVDRCREEVRAAMQAAMDAMAREGGWGRLRGGAGRAAR